MQKILLVFCMATLFLFAGCAKQESDVNLKQPADSQTLQDNGAEDFLKGNNAEFYEKYKQNIQQ